jgi:hypothetical protein
MSAFAKLCPKCSSVYINQASSKCFECLKKEDVENGTLIKEVEILTKQIQIMDNENKLLSHQIGVMDNENKLLSNEFERLGNENKSLREQIEKINIIKNENELLKAQVKDFNLVIKENEILKKENITVRSDFRYVCQFNDI